jgi:hypothetical protein
MDDGHEYLAPDLLGTKTMKISSGKHRSKPVTQKIAS